MILRLNGVGYDHEVLAELLNKEIAISRGASIFPDPGLPSELASYVRMVA
jgi:hypothetical protein